MRRLGVKVGVGHERAWCKSVLRVRVERERAMRLGVRVGVEREGAWCKSLLRVRVEREGGLV